MELYGGEPSILNPNDSNHKLQKYVHDAWGRISENLSAEYPISELKKKKFTYGEIQENVIEGQGERGLIQVETEYSNTNGSYMN